MMRVDRLVAALLFGLALLPGMPAGATGPDPAAADAAFDEGEQARALWLYDEILTASPSDVHALLRSGMLLSWDRKYDEALARYAKALSIEPGNTTVKLERAKVLLWSRRYEEARPAFQSVLADDPKESYALLGTAQSYAWTGQSAKALPWYRRALEAQPDMKEAQMGLAYAELDAGDRAEGEALALALATKYPHDPEVEDLKRAAEKARAPWISIAFDHVDDSDDNRMDTWRLEGGFDLPKRFDLRFGLLRADVRGPVPANADADGSSDAVYAVAGWQPRPGVRGELRAGASRLTDSTGATRTTAIGGVAATFPMASWSGRAAVARDPFLYSPEILDNGIDVTTVSFGASGTAGSRVRIEASAAYGDFSDGNGRVSADAGAWYVWKWTTRQLQLGPSVRYVDYREDLNSGYFDPSDLVAFAASLRSEGALGKSKWSYEAAADAGTQSYTFNGAKASNKSLADVTASVSRPLPHGIGLALYAGWGNSSTASGPGFHSIDIGARVRFTIGG